MSGHVKMTVNLTRVNADRLEWAAALGGDSRTDTVNRAVALYAEVIAMVEIGQGGSMRFLLTDGTPVRLKVRRVRRRWFR